jgi:hypothetical protein
MPKVEGDGFVPAAHRSLKRLMLRECLRRVLLSLFLKRTEYLLRHLSGSGGYAFWSFFFDQTGLFAAGGLAETLNPELLNP